MLGNNIFFFFLLYVIIYIPCCYIVFRVTAPFTEQRFFDEMHGLADASGIDYQMILRLNLFAEVTKASCSFFGAWGPATVGGKTFQLRALDYDTVGPFKDYHVIQIYHPTDGGHPFGMLGWPGSIGMMTGFSSNQMAISEIGVSFADDSFGQGTDNTPPEKVHGKPWLFVTRDAMQFEESIYSAEDTIASTNRTCNLIIGVGDGKAGVVNGIEYSGYVAVPYNDSTLLPVNDTWHSQIEGVVYNGMDWLCAVLFIYLKIYCSCGRIHFLLIFLLYWFIYYDIYTFNFLFDIF